ncbi:serpin family protein [Herbivorax sp. ANBcel31]|uniref:serpin family protein n=1 Tax=Herbivorax sp. ANBcel31 TaxID=3069754 RepID=UPI0027AE0451|nr:serpin family protein [Herbivorax sp. ANBcel31]MDQ2086592.1 serpin family protein [Herbivorax sp. ANBcel31]
MKKGICVMICVFMLSILVTGCEIEDIISNESFDQNQITTDVVDSNSDFAFDIFKKLNEDDSEENVFISPLSISTALSMTMQGAGSTTLEGMKEALKYDGKDIKDINETYKNLLLYLNHVDKKIDLDINNSIWIREGEDIKENFQKINKDIFNAYITQLDFSKDDAADKINGWIADSTNDKIKKMIDPPIDPNIVMYLINAIYFKGEWANQFEKDDTFNAEFNTGFGTKKEIDMMSKKSEVEYGQRDDYQAVRLPYGNGNTSMYCILPSENISINEFIQDLNKDKWKDIRESISKKEDVIVNIPRFKMEYGIKNLNDTLISMGMEEAFSGGADFSGMREGLFIDEVLHKAVIEVNEEGSEAAGATVVVMRESAMAEPISFIADRPFVFLITDDTTGTILFMGKLYNP